MAQEIFRFESLATIDGGRIREAFEQAFTRARLDCQDRPALSKARTVQINVQVVPVADPDGTLHSCQVTVEIDDKLPKRVSPTYDMRAGRGGFLFNELSPDDASQSTLDQAGMKLAGGSKE